MGMMSSLFTAISGLKGGQTLLNVIGNNVANVNTTGFKAGRIQFRDLLSGSLSGGAGSNAATGRGGINPMQVGTGLGIAAIDTRQRQGTLLATGNPTDLAVNGDGFFVTKSGTAESFTRAGSFRFDSLGRLVDAGGGLVQGWSAALPANDPLGRLVIDASNPADIGNISIRPAQTLQARETRSMALVGNLDAGATPANMASYPLGAPGTRQLSITDALGGVHTYTTSIHTFPVTIYDSLGNPHELTITFQNISNTQKAGKNPGVNAGNNQWVWAVSTDPGDPTVSLALDDMTYTDPATGAQVRTGGDDGELHFDNGAFINGAPDHGSNADDNTAAQLAQYGILADPHVATGEIGIMNRENVVAGDFAGDTTLTFNSAPFYDNPGIAGFAPFDIHKLPLVLVYQDIPAGSPLAPPAGITAGTPVNVNFTDMTTTAATPTQCFVQKIDLDFGTLATQPDWDFDPDDDGIQGSVNPAFPDRQHTSLADGQRDGLTQDTAGQFEDQDGVVRYVPAYTARVRSQDGYPAGSLASLSVDAAGTVHGVYDNGVDQDLARVAIATFTNPAGLARGGDTRFVATANSGAPRIGSALTGARGAVIGGALEQSNVELGEELTDMIVAQRSYEASARLVSLSDRLLDTVVNVGRA